MISYHQFFFERYYYVKTFNLMCANFFFFFKKILILLDDIVVRPHNPRSPCKVNEHRVLQNFPPILYGPECHPVGPPNVESPLNNGSFSNNDWTYQPSHTISYPKYLWPFKNNHRILMPTNYQWCFSSHRIAYHKHTSEPIKWLKNRHVLLEGLTLITWEGATDYVEVLSPLWFLVFREDGKLYHFNLSSFSFNYYLSSGIWAKFSFFLKIDI